MRSFSEELTARLQKETFMQEDTPLSVAALRKLASSKQAHTVLSPIVVAHMSLDNGVFEEKIAEGVTAIESEILAVAEEILLS